MDIKRIADNLANKFHTRDPFKIAEELHYVIVRSPLVGIRGFYLFSNKRHSICIDANLSEYEARFVCAHEIGHSILHKKSNRVFRDMHTHLSPAREEKEADRFAVNLLFDDEQLADYLEHPIQIAADFMGVSRQLAEYRMHFVLKKNTERK